MDSLKIHSSLILIQIVWNSFNLKILIKMFS